MLGDKNKVGRKQSSANQVGSSPGVKSFTLAKEIVQLVNAQLLEFLLGPIILQKSYNIVCEQSWICLCPVLHPAI